MQKNTTILIVTDLQGRVLGAHVPSDPKGTETKGEPVTTLTPREGQQVLSVEIPNEVFQLPGPCLHRLFSEIKIRRPGEVVLPKIKIAKTHG